MLHGIYGINPALFENSANLIGEVVNHQNENIIGKGDLLIAYDSDEARGVAEAFYVSDLDRYVFIMNIFTNNNPEKITFRFKPASNNTEQLIIEELKSASDAVFGEPMKPLALHLSNSTGINTRDDEMSLSVYPNPVNDKLQIVSGTIIKSVALTGISGNCIELLSNVSGFNLEISTQNLVPGVYLLKIETERGIAIRKLIKSSGR
jgi:hypothetical protein